MIIEIFYFKAGGGHVAAASALHSVIKDLHPDWTVRLVDLQELLRPIDPLRRLTRIDSEQLYNFALKKGFTYGASALLTTIQAAIRVYAPLLEKNLRRHWGTTKPDMVISVIPNFNRVMFRALRSARPETPYVTIMTDIADIPDHFWQEKQNQYLICGSDRAMQQARDVGYPAPYLWQTSGMILKPSFYQAINLDRRVEREKLGLHPDKPTALIMYGGNGSTGAIAILSQFAKAKLDIQAIVMCGHNELLRSKLSMHPACHAVGFTEDVARYMKLADFFIGKPGPASISEAVHMGLPVIVEAGRRTMPQERYNIKWLEENELGIGVTRFSRMAETVRDLLANDRLEQLRANVTGINNRAVFEIPAMLEDIAAHARAAEQSTSFHFINHDAFYAMAPQKQ